MLDSFGRNATETVGAIPFDGLPSGSSHGRVPAPEPHVRRLKPREPSDVETVPVESIKPLDGGSRLLRNPKWLAIKESIRASGGLTDALAVTRRPGDQHFTCFSGGNTRILALQELYRETGARAFGSVRVDIRPFTNDFDLAALHHRENACRGDCTFFEDAWATYRMYKTFCEGRPAKTTASAFLACIREKYGLSISAEAFSRIKFTVEVLYQHLPTCLVQGGMSLRAVRRLIAMRTALRKVWEARAIGTKAEFDEAFYGLLARQDQDLAETFAPSSRPAEQYPDERIAIDWETFREDMQHEIAVQAEISYQAAGAWIAAAFRRCDPHSEEAVSPSRLLFHHRSRAPSSSSVRPVSTAGLRRRACALAREIGACAGIEDLIEPLDGDAGYMVTDRPAKTASPQSRACWWLLVLSASSEDEIRRHMASMTDDIPSFQGLPAAALQTASKLLDTHSRLARGEQSECHA